MKTDNELIAEFMGLQSKNVPVYKYIDDPNPVRKEVYLIGVKQYSVDKLKYHTSWNWLMPVVEKIESLGYRVLIVTDEVDIESNAKNSIQKSFGTYCPDGTKKGATYKAVVGFINWYNENNK